MKSVFMAIAFALSAPVFAGPVEVVKASFGAVVEVVQSGNEAQQIRTMCRLAHETADLEIITSAVLGKTIKSGENKAIANFKELVPSIIATDLMNVSSYFKYGIDVDSKVVPRGGTAKGVRMNIEVSKANNNYLKFIVVLKPNAGIWKIVDLEIVSYDSKMIELKRNAFAEIMAKDPAHPVAFLVDQLNKDRDLIHCR